MTQSSFERDVAAVLRSLGPGDVVTYGEVALEAGHPGAARAVGSFLRRSAEADFAWWRVVTSTGRLVPGAVERQSELLRAEGVQVVDGHVRPMG